MKKFKHQYTAFLIIFLFSMLFGTIHAYAAGAGSQADSPGTKGAKPLSFTSCILEDGSKINTEEGITLQPKFKFEFDKNVVNMLVWENNSKCFSLSLNNINVPIIVSKIDDTVDSDSKQLIFMHPKNKLEPGKTYYIKISPELLAKNNSTLGGSTNGQGITLSFKTQGKAAKPGTNSNSSTADNTAVNSPDANQNTSQNSSAVSKMTINNWIELVSGIVIAGWLITEFLIKRKLKKGRDDKPSV